MTEEALFELALNTPEAECAILLDRECMGNPELIARVEALLAANASTGPFLRGSPPGSFSPTTDMEGVVLAGKYKLLERIGEGGMGSVWLANQSEPVKRRVAVKLIKTGMDSRQVLARFEAERQALAMMDHPNIARVLDGGLTPDGRPFFVMELVKGLSITEFCDAKKLSPQQRLELFVPVCQAIQHAHQKGIIHRDIKPSNVLIALYDDKPAPKVIDFGVAKATGQQLSEQSISTGFEGVVGTPPYMSPEQATFNNLDIDTRSDVYSLGVLLYELLVGSPPFSRKELQKKGLFEMLRVVREDEPPKPSDKLSTADALPTLSANRSTEPKKLTAMLRSELDWIVLKVLEKNRGRRYETANGFAADVQRYLAGEAVLAHPPSPGYRFAKFLRKNRGPVWASALVALALLVGILGTTLGLLRAEEGRRDAERAREEEAIQRVLAETKEREAVAVRRESEQSAAAEKIAKKKAEQAEADTLADYRASTDDAIEQLIGSKPEIGPKEKAYLEQTLKRWQVFANRQGDDVRSRGFRGEGHHRVAVLWQNLGRNEEAGREYRAALDLRKKLGEEFPAVPEHQQNLASTHNGLGIVLKVLGKHKEAMAEHRAALDIRKQLVKQFPAVPVYAQELARTHNSLAALLAVLDRRQEARVEYQAALDIRKKLVEQFPGAPRYQAALAPTHTSLGFLLQMLGMPEEALVEYQAALAVGKKLVEKFPASPDYQQNLAAAHHGLGLLFMNLGKRGEAQAECQASRAILKKLVEQFPAMPTYKEDLAGAHNNLGLLFMRLGKREEALAEYRAALDIKKKLVEQFPAVPTYKYALSRSHLNMAELFRVLGKGEEARGEFRAAIDIQKKLVEHFPTLLEYQYNLGLFCSGYGTLLRNEGNLAESLKWFDQSIQTLKPVHEKEPLTLIFKRTLRSSHLCAQIYDLLKKPAEAVKDWDRTIELSSLVQQPAIRANRANSQIQAGMAAEAVAEVEKLTKNSKWTQGHWYNFACVYSLASRKIADKKTEYADRAIELLKKAVQMGYKDAAHMKTDSDLDPLRDRDDFKQLLAELGK